MLECRQLTKHFGRRSALDRLDLTVATGEILAVLGPSGSGKSTLLRAIAGLEDLDAGSVWWDGEDVTARPVHERGFGRTSRIESRRHWPG
jgi:thiamine transport system ATP-binding protein